MAKLVKHGRYRFPKGGSLFYSLIISNFIILMIAIAVACIGFIGYNSFSARQSHDYKTVILRQIKSSFDEKMSSINKLILKISSDSYVESLVSIKGDLNVYERYNTVKALKSMEEYVNVYSFIDSMILYYQNAGFIITNTTMYPSAEAFLDQSSYAYWDWAQWQDLFKNVGYMKYQANNDVFTIVKPVVIGSNAYLLMNVKLTFIEDLLQNLKSLENSAVIVKNNDTGDIVLELGSLPEGQLLVEDLRPNAVSTQEFNGERYILSSIPSDVNNWSYYFIIQENAFIDQAVDILTISLVILILTAGAVICFLLAKRIFNPIKTIVMDMSRRADFDLAGESGRNELAIIGEISGKTIDEYNKMKDQMAKYVPILQARLLEEMFHGSDIPDAEDLSNCGIALPGPVFCLLLIAAEPENDSTRAQNNLANINIMEYARRIITGHNTSVYCVDMGVDRICILVNTQSYEKETLLTQAKQISEYASRHFSMILTIAASGAAQSLEQINALYIRCSRTLDSQLIKFTGATVFTEETQLERTAYYYPMEVETQLVNSVRVGSMEAVSAIIDNLILENFDTGDGLSPEASKCLFFNMMSTAIKVLDALGYSTDEVLGKGEDPYQAILSCSNIQEMEVALRRLFSGICLAVQKNKRKPGASLAGNISEYIRKNSSDPMLSLLSVASAFDLNPNYLSGCFKEQTGENFINFLNKVRLENAKELLRDPSLSINAVAQRAGYSNSAVLIRNFKKYCGVTPGQYRTSLGDASSR